MRQLPPLERRWNALADRDFDAGDLLDALKPKP